MQEEDSVPHKPRDTQRFKVVEAKSCVCFHDLDEGIKSACDNRRFKYGLRSTNRIVTDKRRLGRTPKREAYKQKIRKKKCFHAVGTHRKNSEASPSLEYQFKDTTYSRKLQYYYRPPIQGERSARRALVKGNPGIFALGGTDIVKNWSECERRILETSLRKSILKTYSGAWKSWRSRADQQGIIAKIPSPADVARYLCFLHNTRTLALATILPHKSTTATFSGPRYTGRIFNNCLKVIANVVNRHIKHLGYQ
nr:unnamed protein product [Callosobruchus analis]